MKDYVIGIDIGGTKCAVVLGEAGEADEDCRIFDRVCFFIIRTALTATRE